ncbi:hypothetical protein [Aurantimonas coralicida]|uniref:hypothetical protein n=1 Tax=Aurantimonas coralicida TaxID=182270 RepID=UPI001E2BF057|nr:hypothetical protein [Aurantimonas coralicida]MCD1645228.1 hypothetical protein [Aurantimonas coralicida]
MQPTLLSEEQIAALSRFNAAELEELRTFLEERKAKRWVLARVKGVAAYVSIILGAFFLAAQFWGEWARGWFGK